MTEDSPSSREDDPLKRFVAHETAKMDLQDCIGLHWAQIEGKVIVQIPTKEIPRHRAALKDAIQRLRRLAGEWERARQHLLLPGPPGEFPTLTTGSFPPRAQPRHLDAEPGAWQAQSALPHRWPAAACDR
jgi:hypothetical protein